MSFLALPMKWMIKFNVYCFFPFYSIWTITGMLQHILHWLLTVPSASIYNGWRNAPARLFMGRSSSCKNDKKSENEYISSKQMTRVETVPTNKTSSFCSNQCQEILLCAWFGEWNCHKIACFSKAVSRMLSKV